MSTNRRWAEIEHQARLLQRDIWSRRSELWSVVPEDALELLEPGVGLRLRGFTLESSDSLGELNYEGRRAEVAGIIDMANKEVKISMRLPKAVQRFTAAHELGHAVLHPWATELHRDRPLCGSDRQRSQQEREADRFATCFLMPAKAVRSRFIETFGTERFRVTDDTAFALCTTSIDGMLSMHRSTRDLSRRLAEAHVYGGVSRVPLASMFDVSTTAMAIRLEELGLVEPRGQGQRLARHRTPALL